jgi:hypothetical protein
MFLTKKFKILASGFLFVLLFSLALQSALPALALQNAINPWGSDSIKTNIQENVGLGDGDPRSMIASVLRIILGFLGLIAVVIILFAGFKWMTSGGNEENVTAAKKTLTAGIIGLIIIIAAFAIANFVLNSLINASK